MAKKYFHYIILFHCVAIVLNYKDKALQIPDLLGKGCIANILPILFELGMLGSSLVAQDFQSGSEDTSVFHFSPAHSYEPPGSTDFSTSSFFTRKD